MMRPCSDRGIFRFLAIATLGALVVTLAVALPGVSADGGEDKNTGQGQAPPIPDKTALNYPNLGSHLDQLVASAEEGQATSKEAAGEAPVHSWESVAVTIYLTGNVDAVVSFLENNGGDPRNVGEDYIEAYVPVALLGQVSEQPGVVRVREIVPPQAEYGPVTSQGVQAHLSAAWNSAGYTGQGVKVGIIDVFFEGLRSLMGTELPATVVGRCYTDLGQYSSDLAACDSIDSHGTAVAEAIVDVAPDVSLYIANPRSAADHLNTVRWMAGQGVTVINRSASRVKFEGPGDGTSPVSNNIFESINHAVDNAIVWVNSAGNYGDKTWFRRAPYVNPDNDKYIDFAPGVEVSFLTLSAGEPVTIVLRWEDDWPGARTDLDLHLYDAFSGRIVFSSEDFQTGGSGHYPIEAIDVETRIDRVNLGIAISHESGGVPDWVQVQLRGAGGLQYVTEFGSINNAAESTNPGMLAVGATHWWDTHSIADYSSRGPTPDGRVKPDIVGTACGETASYPPSSNQAGTITCWFPGTSQAAPHVAGMAALVRQRFQDYTPLQVASYLKDFAEQRETPDPNNTWGHGFAQLPSPDRAALVALYNATGGANWTNNDGWLTNTPIGQWHGVTTDGNGRVTSLDLNDNQLSGTIPTQLGNLANLEELLLTRNQLTGTIPAELASLTGLDILALGGNQLTGTIPTWLGNLANLEELYLWENELTGTIPSELDSLSNLELLSLSSNQLTGEIPPELGSLSNLVELSLWENELTGTIPSELGNLSSLELLSLSSNQLTGEIPPELGSLSNLVELSLWGNELTGEIPAGLGSLANLEELWLSRNQLTGEIPPEVGSLSNLVQLVLWGNELTGEIPADLGSLANLEELSLSSNQLTGEIPPELGSLSNLVQLVLWGNELTGEIPAGLGSLANLEELWLSRNQLTGEIPPEVGSLSNLVQLVLWGNELTGEIPADLGSLANLEELSLSSNQLTGEIPAELGSLVNLKELWLSENRLTGEIPADLGSLANLELLSLSSNQLTGEIPPELGNLTNLEGLYLWDNQLSGTVPQTLVGLTVLESFIFHYNPGLCAPIDEAFQTWLGSISTVLGSSCAPADSPEDRAVLVQVHSATDGANWTNNTNWLSEHLTREWYGVTNDSNGRVHGLFLGSNQLTGKIPSELGDLANLRLLSLRDNQLTGGIPPELGSLANLEWLRLNNNQLTGEIPAELGRLTNLKELHLSGNQLTGCVPASLKDVADNDFAQLGLPFCPPGDPLVARYDANDDGAIDIGELFTAIDDYFAGVIGIGELFTIIDLYFSGPA